MTQVSLSTSTTFDGDNALVEDQGTDVTFRIDLDEPAPAGGTRVYIDSDTVQIFNRLDLPAARTNPRVENIDIFSVRTNIDDSGLAFTINPGETFATVTLTVFDNPEPDTFLPATFDGRVDAEFFVRTASEVTPEDAEAITVNGITVSDDITVNPNRASSVVIFVDDVSQLAGSSTNTPPVADNDSYSTEINTVLTVDAGEGVLDGDTDADGDSLTATIENQPSNGSATLSNDGSFTYTPNNGFSGNDSFTYIANDGTDDSTPATVSITVNPLEKPTVGITLDKSDVIEGESITLTINVDGEIPAEGLEVFINDVANAQNDITRSLTEFDVGNVQLTGIDGFPSPAEGDSGFFVTVTEPTATIILPVLDDGFDEDEANEVFTFEVIDQDAYEVDTNASSVTISITDNEVAVNPRSSDFEDGTVQGWTVGQPGNHFAPPENIPSGGPDGAEDNYLRTQSQGGSGTGSRLVWFNQSADWRGNYIEDGATSIKASLINEGSEDVVIRVGFDGAGGRFVTTEGITLTPGSGWQEATFSIEPEDLTAVGGSNVEATLSNVSQIRFLNNATPSYQGAAVAAQVGVDDITFISETKPSPVVSFSITPEVVSEADTNPVINISFTVEGDIPTPVFDADGNYVSGGLSVLYTGPINELFEQITGGPDTTTLIPGPYFDAENNIFELILLDNNATVGLTILDDVIQEADQTFTLSLVENDGVIDSEYTLNPEAASDTVTLTDGVDYGDTTVGISVSQTELTEGDEFEVEFGVNGEIPTEGLQVVVQSPTQGALGEFAIFDENGNFAIESQGIAGDPEAYDGQGSSFLVTLTEPDASLRLSVFDDGPGEGTESLTFNLLDGEAYEVNADASSVTVNIDDGETPTEPIGGWSPGDSFDLVTPPPMYEGELSDGEQANAEFVDQLEGAELLEDLQDGGYVIYFRHAQTERDYADQVTADVNNFSTQRVLSEFGIQQSLAIGEGFEISQIPYDEVITSQYGRAVKTAAIAFGEYQKDPALNFLPFEDYTDAQVEEMRASVTPLLTAVPDTGTNTIIVGHDDLFEAGTGIYPDPQGIAYLLKPDGSGEFDIIANLLPEEWVELSEGVELPEVTPMEVEPSGGMGNGTGQIAAESSQGWTPGDSFSLVTPPPSYEGPLAPGEQANAEFVDQLEGEELLDELQDGGYVIYFRHAQTERDFADQVTADVNNFSTQRVLSEFGVKQSLAIGEGFELSEIPIGSVTTSDYGRAVETAAIAFGEYEKDSALNFLPFEDYTDAQVEEMRANVLPLLTAVPETGTNSIIVGHDDLFEAGTGIYPDPQGIAYVLDPDGNGGFEIVANLLPEEWVELSQDVVPEPPVVAFSADKTTLVESNQDFVELSFNVDGAIPTEGLPVSIKVNTTDPSKLFFVDFSAGDFEFESGTPNVQDPGNIWEFKGADDGTDSGLAIVKDDDIFAIVEPPYDTINLILTENTASIRLPILDDTITEANETVTFTLEAGDGYTVADTNAPITVTLRDGDSVGGDGPTVSLSANATKVVEGQEITFTIDLDEAPSEDGVRVLIDSDIVGSTGEFAVSRPRVDTDGDGVGDTRRVEGVTLTGVADPFSLQPNEDGSGFFVTVTEQQATLKVTVADDGIEEGTESFTYTVVEGEDYNVSSSNGSVTFSVEDGPIPPEAAQVEFTADENDLVTEFAYEVTGVAPGETAQVSVSQEALDITDASFDNLVGFYEVIDSDGGIDTDGDGVADINPGDAGYAQAALGKAVEGFALRIGGDSSNDTTAGSFGDVVVEGGKLYAPFAIANAGDLTVEEFLTINPDNMAATEVEDQVAYFAYIGANPDGANHLKSWGDGIFGFEDLPSNLAGVSDNDFNDAVFKFNFTA